MPDNLELLFNFGWDYLHYNDAGKLYKMFISKSISTTGLGSRMTIRYVPSSRRLIAIADRFREDGLRSDASRLYFKAGTSSLQDSDIGQAVLCFGLAIDVADDRADSKSVYTYARGALDALSKHGDAVTRNQRRRFYNAALEAGEAIGIGRELDMLRVEAAVESIEFAPVLSAALRRIDDEAMRKETGIVVVHEGARADELDPAACEVMGDQRVSQGRYADAAGYYRYGVYLARTSGDQEYARRVSIKHILVLEDLGDFRRSKGDYSGSDKAFEEAVLYANAIGDSRTARRIAEKMKHY